jgi:hypothetical protein
MERKSPGLAGLLHARLLVVALGHFAVRLAGLVVCGLLGRRPFLLGSALEIGLTVVHYPIPPIRRALAATRSIALIHKAK